MGYRIVWTVPALEDLEALVLYRTGRCDDCGKSR